jgi:tetratricopeptide (TPR) repeat protein
MVSQDSIMKTRLVLMLVASGWAGLVAQTTDPAKLEDFKKRFTQATVLADSGKLAEARAICDGILLEEPNAPGSLYLGGAASLSLEDYSKAVNYLERLRALRPKDHRGLLLLVQAYQALKMKEKVEETRQALVTLRGQNIPGLSDAASYGREKLHGPDNSMVVILEYFEPQKSPNRLWELKQLTVGDKTPRNLAIVQDPGAAGNYQLVEYMTQPDGTYRLFEHIKKMPKPEYEEAKQKMLAALQQAPPAL